MIESILEPIEPTTQEHSLVSGEAFNGFMNRIVREDAQESVRESAIQVLSTVLESGPDSTGLVVGRVQSGKTLSYEAVIALARDNGFSLVVVISGISNPLLAQGEKRLREDLVKADPNGWKIILPNDKQQSGTQIKQALENVRANWSNPDTPSTYRQTALVVLLKHHGGIQSLADLLREVDFSDQRVLVVDDEADQASLNTLVSKGKQSTTFQNLVALRNALPGHYYLQYTATPQAPLLIAIDDALAPDFVRVLEPGNGYTGGERYFGTNNQLIATISTEDLQAADHPNGPPPISLRQAMQEFLIGAAHVVTTRQPSTRSMLVHPSRQKDAHADFVRWISSMKRDWQDKHQHEHQHTPIRLQDEFQKAWKGLQATYPNLAPFDECWKALGIVFQNLQIVEVNTRQGPTPVVDWSPTQSYILVGGQAIDRGFTVEGLTVTYMPRGPGGRTADTIQQRARFFGYKASYLGLCRVYLDADVRSDFMMYVDHERDMLRTLKDIESGAESLKDWKRQFLLDSRMKATRASVISIPMVHVNARDRWVRDATPLRDDAIEFTKAREAAKKALTSTQWCETEFQHKAGYTTFTKALELLVNTSSESLLAEPNFQALLLNLSRLRDQYPSDNLVRVIWMRPQASPSKRQVLKSNPKAIQPFQGRNTSGYHGDSQEFDSESPLTIQLHQIQALSRGDKKPLGDYLVTAWRVPEQSDSGWYIETGS